MGETRRSDAHPAERSSLRLLALGVAVSVVVAALSAFVVADPRGRVVLPGWLVGIILAAFGSFVLVGAVSPWLSARGLRRGAALGVGLFFAALVLFAPATGLFTTAPSGDTLPWALTALGGIVVAAVAAGGARLGWSAILAWVILVVTYRALLGGYSLTGLANDAQAVTGAAALCVIAASALEASRQLDVAAERVETAMAEQGASRGRLAARARVASFVHDEVLAALRGAAEGVPETAEAVRDQARRATAVIESDRGPTDQGATDQGPGDWIEQLRALAEAASADIHIERARREVVPTSAVADALLIAARQALENSVRHAGVCVRTVQLRVVNDAISLHIVDDGVGFSPSGVEPGRLGIATSIEGAMRDVAGGVATVTSRPGHGTRVELRWERTDALSHDLADRPLRRGSLFGRASGLAAIALFIITQTAVAVVAATSGPGAGWSPLLLLANILLAGVLVTVAVAERRVRTALIAIAVVLLWVTVLCGLLTTPAPLTYGSAWFLPASGFVLVAVALIGRPILALGGLIMLLAMFGIDAFVRGGDAVHVVSVAVRTATIVGLGTLLSVSIGRMRRSTRAFAHSAARAAEQREWDNAARCELERHAGEMDELARPLLERIVARESLDDSDRARARAIEGRLRDGYRAGRLQHDALTDAAMRARLRGADVVLLDDSGDAAIDEDLVVAVAAWMAGLLDAVDDRFVGRLLPQGRAAVAQVVVDGIAHNFLP